MEYLYQSNNIKQNIGGDVLHLTFEIARHAYKLGELSNKIKTLDDSIDQEQRFGDYKSTSNLLNQRHQTQREFNKKLFGGLLLGILGGTLLYCKYKQNPQSQNL